MIATDQALEGGSIPAAFSGSTARVPNFAQRIMLAYETCASAQVPRNFVGAQACQWRHGTLIAPQPATMSTIALVTACVPWP